MLAQPLEKVQEDNCRLFFAASPKPDSVAERVVVAAVVVRRRAIAGGIGEGGA